MGAMSSTASQESQASLHLQRKVRLYAVEMTLGNKIKKAREGKKRTLQWVADELDVTKQLVWQWERDKADARTHIEGLAKALEMPVDYFYGPIRSPATLEGKIKLLSPANRDFIETMADKFLAQQEAEKTPLRKVKE
jgi:transcriptional regulator with XRE-family HTH domain